MLGICFRCCIIYFSLKLWIQSNMTRFLRLQVFESEYVSVHVNVGERSLRPNIAVVFFQAQILCGELERKALRQTVVTCLEGWGGALRSYHVSLRAGLWKQTFADEQSREEVIGSHKRWSEGRGPGHCFISWNSSGGEQLSVSYTNFFVVMLYKPC